MTITLALCDNCVIVGFNDDHSGVGADDPKPLGLLAPGEHLVNAGEDRYFSHGVCEGCGGLPGDRTDVEVAWA